MMRLSHRLKKKNKHSKIKPKNKVFEYLKTLSFMDQHKDAIFIWKALKNKGFCEYEAEGAYWFYYNYKNEVHGLSSIEAKRHCLQTCASMPELLSDEFAMVYFCKD
jgi:hypothetical protein